MQQIQPVLCSIEVGIAHACFVEAKSQNKTFLIFLLVRHHFTNRLAQLILILLIDMFHIHERIKHPIRYFQFKQITVSCFYVSSTGLNLIAIHHQFMISRTLLSGKGREVCKVVLSFLYLYILNCPRSLATVDFAFINVTLYPCYVFFTLLNFVKMSVK